MTLDQERRAYGLYIEGSALPIEKRSLWLDSLANEPEVCAEVRRLLALDSSPNTSDSHNGITNAMRSLGESLFGGNDLIGTILGPYQIESLVRDSSGRHRGGMGFVYRARRIDDAYEQTVAVKVIQFPEASKRDQELFLLERRLLGRVQHRNIVRIFGADYLPDGRPYYIMEWIEDGQDFTDYCKTQALSIRERVGLFLSVCSAVHRAHLSEVLHLDLKPSNIQVDRDGEPKLIDFGISTSTGSEATADFARSLLTPAYASPEQLRREPLSFTSDVYSLGVVLHEALLGYRPLAAEPSDAAVALPKERDLDPELTSAIHNMIAPMPTERYQTVEAVISDLENWLSNKSLVAHRARVRFPAMYVARKFLRRNFAVAALTTAIVVTLIAAFISVTQQRNEAIRQRELATASQKRAERGEKEAQRQTSVADVQRQSAEHSSKVAQEQTKLADANFVESERQRKIAIARELAARAQLEIDSGEIDTGALLAVESSRLQESFEANQAARKALKYLPDRLWRVSLSSLSDHLQFSMDGKFIAALSNQRGTVNVRSADSGKLVFEAEHGLASTCSAGQICGHVTIAFSPSGTQCATSGQDGIVRIWSLTDGKPVRELNIAHSGLHQLEYLHDGALAVSLNAREAGVFDTNTGTLRASFPTEGELPVLSSNEKFYAIEQRSHQARSVSIRAVKTNEEIARIVPPRSGEFILRTRMNPGRPQMAVFVGRDMASARLALVNLDTPKGEMTVNGPSEPIFHLNGVGSGYGLLLGEERHRLQFSKDGHYLVAFDDDKGVLVDTVRLRLLKTWPLRAQIESFAEASTLLTPPGMQEIRTYGLPDLHLSAVLQRHFESVALSPSGQQFAVTGSNKELELWAPHDAANLAKSGPADYAAFSRGSRYLASIHHDGTLSIQSTASEREVFRDQLERVNEIFCAPPGLEFSRSDKYLALNLNGRVLLYASDPWRRVARTEMLTKGRPVGAFPAVPRFFDGDKLLEDSSSSDQKTMLSLPDLRVVQRIEKGKFIYMITPNFVVVKDGRSTSDSIVDILALPTWAKLRSIETGPKTLTCSATETLLACVVRPSPSQESTDITVWSLPGGKPVGTIAVTNLTPRTVRISNGRIVVHARDPKKKQINRLEYDGFSLHMVSRRLATEAELLPMPIDQEISPSHGDEGTVLNLFRLRLSDFNRREPLLAEPIASDGERAYVSEDLRFAALNTVDGVLRVEPLMVADLMERVCKQLTHNLTPIQWSRYLPGATYRATCPTIGSN